MNRAGPRRHYRASGPAARAHVAVRWATCPIDATVDLLPATGRILDWGTGHGLVAVAAALRGPGRTVRGVDIDAAKVAIAQAAAAGSSQAARLDFDVIEAGAVPTGSWDGVLVVDVLYLLAPIAQQELVAAAARSVAPGGALVIKDMDVRPRWKARIGRAQEQLSVRVLRLTAATSGIQDPPGVATLTSWLAQAGLEVELHALDAGYHCPHVAVVGRRPVGPDLGSRRMGAP